MAFALGLPETEEEAAAARDFQLTLAAVGSLRRGIPEEQVVARLTEDGLEPDRARRIATAARERKRRIYREDGGRNMLMGGFVLAVGVTVTVGSLVFLPMMGVMVISWGAILFGGGAFVRGANMFFNA